MQPYKIMHKEFTGSSLRNMLLCQLVIGVFPVLHVTDDAKLHLKSTWQIFLPCKAHKVYLRVHPPVFDHRFFEIGI